MGVPARPTGPGDGFPNALKKSIALARANMVQEVTMAVSNGMQVHFVDQLGGELQAAYETAVERLSRENAELSAELATLRKRVDPAAPGGGGCGPVVCCAGQDVTWASEDLVVSAETEPPQAVPLSLQAAAIGSPKLPEPRRELTGGSSNRPEPREARSERRPDNNKVTVLAESTAESARTSEEEKEKPVAPQKSMVRQAVKVLRSIKSTRFEIDDEPTRVNPRSCAAIVVKSQHFEAFFCFVIILNCFSMGVEAHYMVQDEAETLLTRPIEMMEHVFTGLFTIELLMRAWVFGCQVFVPWKGRHMWNFMDLILVSITGILFGWIIPPLAKLLGVDHRSGFLRTLTVFRAVRLLRIVRVVRKVHAFREVYLLLRGLSNSMRILLWTCIVIFFVTYVFAVFGLWLISKAVHEAYLRQPTLELEEVLTWVGGLDRLLGTLVQVLTLDSWTGKVSIIMKYVPWCWLFFYAYIAVAVFVLMNLVTAIIVENAMATSREEADHKLRENEKQMHREMEELKTLFHLMDTDGGGTLDWSEFQQSFSNERMRQRWRLLNFNASECHELFELLDDGDGEIATEEFFEGLQKMKGQAQSKDIVRMTKQLDRLGGSLLSIAQALGLKHVGKSLRYSSQRRADSFVNPLFNRDATRGFKTTRRMGPDEELDLGPAPSYPSSNGGG